MSTIEVTLYDNNALRRYVDQSYDLGFPPARKIAPPQTLECLIPQGFGISYIKTPYGMVPAIAGMHEPDDSTAIHYRKVFEVLYEAGVTPFLTSKTEVRALAHVAYWPDLA